MENLTNEVKKKLGEILKDKNYSVNKIGTRVSISLNDKNHGLSYKEIQELKKLGISTRITELGGLYYSSLDKYIKEKQTIRKDNVSELSLEDLEELNCAYVELEHPSSRTGYVCYPVEEYKELYEKLIELTEGIDDQWDNAKKAIYIYRRISKKLEYDKQYNNADEEKLLEYARTEEFKRSTDLRALKKGEAICQGYGHIYKNALALKGVEAKTVGGKFEDEGHVWNVVLIQKDETGGEKWISQDVTWENNGSMKYAGGNKESFDNEHHLSECDKIKNESKEFISFNWSEFINKELGIENEQQYDADQQARYIDMLENVDMGKAEFLEVKHKILEDIKTCRRQRLRQVAYSRELDKKWEEEVGHSTEELIKLGFTDREIDELQWQINPITGEEFDRKARLQQAMENKTKEMNGNVTMKSLIKNTIEVEPTRSGEVEEADTVERQEVTKENLKEGVSLDD